MTGAVLVSAVLSIALCNIVHVTDRDSSTHVKQYQLN